MASSSSRFIGIDDMAIYVPKQYLSIETLAEQRGIVPAKLTKGLGLQKMAVPAPNEDAASFAANALLELIKKNNIDPKQIGRIYLGTESAVDGSKPTASYAVQMIEQELNVPRAFQHCDVVDMTFACIGAVDALHNATDWVRSNPNKIALVVASDMAKYELGSGGEYTQGAGAVAMSVKSAPRLLALPNTWGVGMESVHDFFKPRRVFTLKELSKSGKALPYEDAEISIFRETPVFDGQYSNECYTNRVSEAIQHFNSQLPARSQHKNVFKRWDYLAFHLPYAAHGRRMGAELLALEMERAGEIDAFCKKNKIEKTTSQSDRTEKVQFIKAFSKSNDYRAFVQKKMAGAQQASGEVGNMYTASIFLALMGQLTSLLDSKKTIEGKKIGFLAYGSGSKSKIFEGKIMGEWRSVVEGFSLRSKLSNRKEIDFETYEQWHKLQIPIAEAPTTGGFQLKSIATAECEQLEGARTYSFG